MKVECLNKNVRTSWPVCARVAIWTHVTLSPAARLNYSRYVGVFFYQIELSSPFSFLKAPVVSTFVP